MQRTIQLRSVETWRELVTRQDRSGLSVQAFCRQERLNAWTFYGWRSRPRKSTAVDRVVVREQNRDPAGFIDLIRGSQAFKRSERGYFSVPVRRYASLSFERELHDILLTGRSSRWEDVQRRASFRRLDTRRPLRRRDCITMSILL